MIKTGSEDYDELDIESNVVPLPAFVFESLGWDGVLDDQPIVSTFKCK